MTTNHQYPGLDAARTVKARPSAHVVTNTGAATEAVGQGRQGQPTQGGEAQDGEADPELGARQAGLVRDGGPVHDPAEMPGHVAQRGDRTELPESRGKGHERYRYDGRIGPRTQSEVVLRSFRDGDPLVLLGDAPGGTDPPSTWPRAPRRLPPAVPALSSNRRGRRRRFRLVTRTRPHKDTHAPHRGRRPSTTWVAHLVLAGVAYVPLLLTAPGHVGADTKAYLYLDPTRWLSVSASMWDPDLAMGSVTHEYIGYLLPMGPYYALMHVLGVPTWVAQRLWTGSLLFLAGAGVLFLLRTLSPSTGRPGAGSLDMGTVGGLGAMVGALGYMLSPYVMQYEARESVLLLPWVGLPWMVGSFARALRGGGWRYPALFALVVALVGSTNAASLIFVGVGPVLWVVWELVTGRVTWQRAVSTAVKVGVLTVAVCAWWIAGLAVEGAYLGNILRDTESIPTVARSSLASETLRGLGYWFFYGVDKLGLYLPTAGAYMTSLWLLAVSFAVPAAAFLAAFFVRWRERAYFVGLILIGTILAVGAHPLSDPSPLGSLVKAGSANSTAGLALRSTNRATPLVILGVAVLLGAAIAALARQWKMAGTIAAVAAAGLVAADIPALWTGQFVTASFRVPRTCPRTGRKRRSSSTRNTARPRPGSSPNRASTSPTTGGERRSIRCSPAS